VAIITTRLELDPVIEHTGGARGWPGDSPLIHLDCARVRALGWRPTVSIAESIVKTVDWLQSNPYAFDKPEVRTA